jgi:hypothetical protein
MRPLALEDFLVGDQALDLVIARTTLIIREYLDSWTPCIDAEY